MTKTIVSIVRKQSWNNVNYEMEKLYKKTYKIEHILYLEQYSPWITHIHNSNQITIKLTHSHNSINFNFLVKYSSTSFLVALFFQLAFSTFLPIDLLKLEVSPSLDPQSPSPIDVDFGVGGMDALDLPLGSAHFGWSFNMSQQCSRRKGFLKVSLYKAFALVI